MLIENCIFRAWPIEYSIWFVHPDERGKTEMKELVELLKTLLGDDPLVFRVGQSSIREKLHTKRMIKTKKSGKTWAYGIYYIDRDINNIDRGTNFGIDLYFPDKEKCIAKLLLADFKLDPTINSYA